MGNKTIQWSVEARLIDDEDTALGDWSLLGSESITSDNHNGIQPYSDDLIMKGIELS